MTEEERLAAPPSLKRTNANFASTASFREGSFSCGASTHLQLDSPTTLTMPTLTTQRPPTAVGVAGSDDATTETDGDGESSRPVDRHRQNSFNGKLRGHLFDNNARKEASEAREANCGTQSIDQQGDITSPGSNERDRKLNIDGVILESTSVQRQISFLTPERKSNQNVQNRERANTCPHRPQRHLILFERIEQHRHSENVAYTLDAPQCFQDEEAGEYPAMTSRSNSIESNFQQCGASPLAQSAHRSHSFAINSDTNGLSQNTNRDRANTCPHRPQSHSFHTTLNDSIHEQLSDDEESRVEVNFHPNPLNSSNAQSSTNDASFDLHTTISAMPEFDRCQSSPVRGTPERRRPSSAPSGRKISSRVPTAVPPLQSFSPSTPLRIRTPSTQVATPLRNFNDRSSTAHTPLAENRPQTPHTTPHSRPSSVRSSVESPQQRQQNHSEGAVLPSRPTSISSYGSNILRVMKVFMLGSLCVLLLFAWNSDFKMSSKPIEIDYGSLTFDFSYNGIPGIAGVGVSRDSSNDSNLISKSPNEDESNMNNIVSAKSTAETAEEALSEVTGPTDVDSPHDGKSPSFGSGVQLGAGSFDKTEKKKRRPSMSHARTLSRPQRVFGNPQQGQTIGRVSFLSNYNDSNDSTSSGWSFARITWIFVWVGFMLPIMEVGIREARRQFRLVNLRRLRAFSDDHIQ